MFAWHKEDMDLFSINYNHFGKPKYWYGLPVDQTSKFEEFMKKNFPEAARECSEFLRHKTFMAFPPLLLNQGIKIHKAIQNPGEFIITLPSAYHAGFNSGYL
jgi:hypothetical protein